MLEIKCLPVVNNGEIVKPLKGGITSPYYQDFTFFSDLWLMDFSYSISVKRYKQVRLQ